LAASALENQHLQTTVDDQQARLQAQDKQIAASQKKIIDLETRLAEAERLSGSAAVPDTPVLTTPSPVAPQTEESVGPNLLVAAGLVVLLLLLMLAFWVRRQRAQAQATPQPLPAQPAARDSLAPHVPENVGDKVNNGASTQKTAAPRREPAEVSDVLEGVNLYVAYGRLGEAVGILREALLREPERLDLGMRLLEVLGQQGDAVGYAGQESHLLESGVSAQSLQDIRSRFGKLSAVPAREPSTPSVLAEVEAPAPVRPAQDEFQLNLDELSMDSEWDLISPFDTTPSARNTPVTDASPGFDPTFTSNLKELPEVFEICDEQFPSDFSESESGLPSASEIEALDEAFLDDFASAPQTLEIEPLSVDFDSLEREQSCAGKLEQAQTCIDDGDLDSAIRLLTELLEEGGEPLQQTARNLLASIR
jgi:FimV-like protein